LENQPFEIFRAAADGEKIHTYLQSLHQQRYISGEQLQDDNSDITKVYDRLVKNPEARRQLEKQNPGLVAALLISPTERIASSCSPFLRKLSPRIRAVYSLRSRQLVIPRRVILQKSTFKHMR